jgi:hypothetical protein
MDAKSTTANVAPKLAMLYNDMDDAHLKTLRRANVLPKVTSPKTDNWDPIRLMLLTDNDAPKL